MFTLPEVLRLIFITFLPSIELRGAIPYGIATGMDPLTVVILVTAINLLLIPLFFIVLNIFWKFIEEWEFVKKHVARLRRKSAPYMDKYGTYGIFFFVAIPLPGSGVYTGVLVAWLLGMSQRKALLPISLGVIVASILVTILTLTTFSLFTLLI